MSKTHYYSAHATALRADLGKAISREQMREFHTKQPWRHFVVAVRQFLILGAATWALIRFDDPLIWLPVALVQGFTVFNFTVLLHEVLHHNVFQTRHPLAERALGFLYAVPSGIAPSQFTRWHLDHHAELGSNDDDPKRHYLYFVMGDGTAMRYGVGVGEFFREIHPGLLIPAGYDAMTLMTTGSRASR